MRAETMSIYGKGAKGRADKLFSQVVRARGACERCGSPHNLQCAHIITRSRNATRCDLRNAWCLCARCHLRLTHWPVEHAEFAMDTIGPDVYAELKALAEAPPRAWRESDWLEIIASLKAAA
jgi:5-methylcytosine-specific restriction endonuclease McrA